MIIIIENQTIILLFVAFLLNYDANDELKTMVESIIEGFDFIIDII